MYSDPKTGALHEASGKRVMSKTKRALEMAKIAGYNNDDKAFIRIMIENRISRARLDKAWQIGAAARTKEEKDGSRGKAGLRVS